MKIKLEIPDAIFRRAKAPAAERGIPLREFVTEAVKEKLTDTRKERDKPGMAALGGLRRLRRESARINRLIEEEFEQVGADEPAFRGVRHGRARENSTLSHAHNPLRLCYVYSSVVPCPDQRRLPRVPPPASGPASPPPRHSKI